ncbi:MAG: prepilin-type N-terminal cleavage/methylation domain-containing protein [Phycisphaeraceae bacterium]
MTARNRKLHGFTLVEILIVVVILGILAAIVIPQFTNASESAKLSSLSSQLQTIRSQLELYQVQHKGGYPTIDATWTKLTLFTDVDGNTNATKTSTFKFGPYLQQAPVNPFEASATTGAAAAAGVGWTYVQSTGVIKAVLSTTKATELNVAAGNDFATYAAAP